MVGLVVLSLGLLITVSFRSTALDPVEGFAASALRPFEIAANRVAQPFRDAASWTHGLFNAKSENQKLKRENAALRQPERAADRGAQNENAQLHKLLRYVQGPSFPKDYDEVGARVLTSPSRARPERHDLGRPEPGDRGRGRRRHQRGPRRHGLEGVRRASRG